MECRLDKSIDLMEHMVRVADNFGLAKDGKIFFMARKG